jgi:nucleoside-triphosphatase THEP1
MDKKGWLLIDEIGPLELKGEGFYNVLKEVLNHQEKKQKIFLVVRDGMVENVMESFELSDAVVIYNLSDLPLT